MIHDRLRSKSRLSGIYLQVASVHTLLPIHNKPVWGRSVGRTLEMEPDLKLDTLPKQYQRQQTKPEGSPLKGRQEPSSRRLPGIRKGSGPTSPSGSRGSSFPCSAWYQRPFPRASLPSTKTSAKRSDTPSTMPSLPRPKG